MLSAAPPTARPPVRLCSCSEVFNLPLFEGFLVLDVRTDAEVADQGGQCISSAHRLRGPGWAEAGAGVADAGEWMRGCFGYMEEMLLWPPFWDRIVVYGATPVTLGEGGMAERAATAVSQLVAEHAADPSHSRTALFAKVDEVWVLAGGFAPFAQLYPALCGGSFEAMRVSPAEVSHRVFLQPRLNTSLPLEGAALRYWGITHVVTDTRFSDAADLEGIVHLVCRARSVGDTGGDTAPDVTDTLSPFGSFLCHALQSPSARVLVKVCDRNTSAVLLVSWLARTHGCTARHAFEDVQSCLRRKIRAGAVEGALQQVEAWLEGGEAAYTHYAKQGLLEAQ